MRYYLAVAIEMAFSALYYVLFTSALAVLAIAVAYCFCCCF